MCDLGAKRLSVEESGSFVKIVLFIKFRILGATINGIVLGFGNILDKIGIEVVEVNLGILNLNTGLVDGIEDPKLILVHAVHEGGASQSECISFLKKFDHLRSLLD